MSQDALAFRVFNEIGIIEQLSRTLFEKVMPKGMTLPQFSVLNHFVRLQQDSSPARLANAFQVTKQTMTSTLQRLERNGLITIRPDPDDGRAKIVAITKKGIAARNACLSALGPAIARVSALMPKKEFEILLPHLSKLRQSLDEDRNDDRHGS